MSKKKILIVDDEEDIRDILKRVLLRVGYDVATAEDGVSALEMIKTFKPDLIFLDIMMPGMNGLQFLEKIIPVKDRSYNIVIVSGYANEEMNQKCLDQGIHGLIKKPFEVRTIVKAARDNLM